MAYPAGFSSDDDFDGFLSDDTDDSEDEAIDIQARIQNMQDAGEPQLTMEQKLNNLYYAIMNGNVDEVSSIIENGIDVNCMVRDGWSPILLAASIGNPDTVKELIRRGADVNSNRDKYTVLMAVCNCPEKTSPASKCLDIVTQLIEHGAMVDAITRTRKTALMFAANNGRVEIIRKLLPHANIHAEDNQGWNALFWAVNDNQVEVVRFLLEEGLNPDKIDVRGNTPISIATMNDSHEILDMFPMEINRNNTIQDVCYEVENIFNTVTPDQKPQFYVDICCMLFGMKCEDLMEKFANVALVDFLCLNDKKLCDLGIVIPYQRHRILSGLYKYHKHLYKQKSIPIIPKDSLYSTIDVSNALISAVRQLISMEASIKYVSNYDNMYKQDKKPFPTHIVREKIYKLRKTAAALNARIQLWDIKHLPADLITKRYQRRCPRWTKWLACLSILTATAILTNKIRLGN